MKNIGESIRSYRKIANLTQAQLAEAAGLSLMSIRRYETNERTPDLSQLQQIADALKLSLAELLGFEYKDNTLDTNDVFMFFDSLGYILKNTSNENFELISKDIANPLHITLTWEQLKNIKHETWRFLKFSLADMK